MQIVQIVSNPKAGKYDPALIEKLKAEFEHQGAKVSVTEAGPGLPLAIEKDTNILCVVGGDGSLRHAVAAIQESGLVIALAAWPGGTINLFQREYVKPKGIENFVRETLSESRESHFAVQANDTLFLGCASIGPDAWAVANVSDRLKRRIGRFAYGAACLRLLIRWPRASLTVSANGEDYACEAAYIAKGRYFAGPWSFAPNARRTEGTLQIVLLKKAGRLGFLRFMSNVMMGRTISRSANHFVLETDQCQITSDSPCPIQLDGDNAAALPLTLKVARHPFEVT